MDDGSKEEEGVACDHRVDGVVVVVVVVGT